MPALCPGSYVRNVNEPLLPFFVFVFNCDVRRRTGTESVCSFGMSQVIAAYFGI